MDKRLVAADAAIRQGQRHEAADLIVAALVDGVPPSPQIYTVLLKNLLAVGRFGDMAHWAARAVAFAPDHPVLLNLLGVALRRTARYDAALDVLNRAIALHPDDSAALVNKGNVLNDMGDGAAAEPIFIDLIERIPDDAGLHRSLAQALWIQDKLDAAAARMRQALALQSDNPEIWLDLAAILSASGQPDAAMTLLDDAISHFPDHPAVLRRKAAVLRHIGNSAEARRFLDAMRERMGGMAWYHHEYGHLFTDANDGTSATEHYRRAFELEPANVDYRLALVESLDMVRGFREGPLLDEAYQLVKGADPAGQLTPGQERVIIDVLTRSADFSAADAIGSFQRLGRNWAANGAHGALFGHLARVRSTADRHELVDQHRLWGEKVVDRARRHPIRRPAQKRSSPKIRLGFLSSDLREHVVGSFTWPLFEHADRERFEIYCYSFYTGGQADRAQQYIASRVDGFRWNPFMGDRDAAQMIADDDLDILFELGGSTRMNKLDVMAWKPARIQASWLGYPHSSGLGTIDYLLVDPFLNPADPRLLIERPLIMPRSWITMCEQAFPSSITIEPEAPVRRNGFITFGTANNPYKFNEPMLRTWARVMARVPGSRFILIRPEGGSQTFTRNIRRYFADEGIAADRIEFRAVRGGHMRHYDDIDIALDTFPQTGGTTTCDALWMGVPTVTLVGPALFERLSYSILSNAGLPDLCAATHDEFVGIAVRLAGDTARIQTLRTGLRDQISKSPLGQTEQFALDFYDLVARTAQSAPPLSPSPPTA